MNALTRKVLLVALLITAPVAAHAQAVGDRVEVNGMQVSMPCNKKRKIRETTKGKFTCLYTFGNYLLFVHKLTCLYTFAAWGSLIN